MSGTGILYNTPVLFVVINILFSMQKSIHRIAVIIPCYNEALSIGLVVHEFQHAIPDARIYVFDNNSTDDTIAIARAAGAIVQTVPMQGKGNVMRRMFADVEADIYVLADGDGTYDATAAPVMIEHLISQGLDMVVGARCSNEEAAYRRGHRFGNMLLTSVAGLIFGRTFSDMLSGYRVFSRRYVKSFPGHSIGFEIETELTVHALQLRMPVIEVPTVYRPRLEGSVSKLCTWQDGILILWTLIRLFKSEKSLAFFSIGFSLCALLAILLALPLFKMYLATGLVPRLPTALLCAALTLFGAILLVCGIVLDAVTQGRIEGKRLAYLAISGPSFDKPTDTLG